jgi:hypothetical protein
LEAKGEENRVGKKMVVPLLFLDSPPKKKREAGERSTPLHFPKISKGEKEEVSPFQLFSF